MTTLLSGCALDRFPGSKFCRDLDFIELRFGASLPRPSTLCHKRSLFPDNLVFVLRAPKSAIASPSGPFRFDANMQKALDWTLESADALGVEAVVIPTPSGFATSRRERDLFASFADRLPRDKRRIWVWETNGLWDSDKSYPFAEKLGLICAFDPLMEAAPQSDVLYARFTALGVRTHISESMLSEALRTLIKPSIKTVYAVFDFKGSTRRAKLLKKLAQAPHFP